MSWENILKENKTDKYGFPLYIKKDGIVYKNTQKHSKEKLKGLEELNPTLHSTYIDDENNSIKVDLLMAKKVYGPNYKKGD